MEPRRFFSLLLFAALPLLLASLVAARLPLTRTPEPACAAAAVPASVSEAGKETPAPQSEPQLAADLQETVQLLRGNTVELLTMQEYLLGVVAAEMPASFPEEALKAQAAAARTDTLYRRSAQRHPGADCCDDPACCKAYLDPEQMAARWGSDCETYTEKLRRAVEATDGAILTYADEPILAAFHACSPGSTACSEDVWVSALPYLRSVSSPEDPARVPRYRETLRLTEAELRNRLLAAWPGADLSGSADRWLTELHRGDDGRLNRLLVGGIEARGTELRRCLGLRSTAVSWICTEGEVCFKTLGSGHGVGMSQYGAEAMALEGADWQEILTHYYTGAEIAFYSGADRHYSQ